MTSRRRARVWLLAPVALAFVAGSFAPRASADSVPGSAGTDTSLPATDSQVTVNGRGLFKDLAVTVNQTRNLTNQAVSITWSGGRPTSSFPALFGANYLQIMQCWGDDDGTVPENPGPPPEQCVAGAAAGSLGSATTGQFPPTSYTLQRMISQVGWTNLSTPVGVTDSTGIIWRPFRAVDGTVIGQHVNWNFNPTAVGGNYWLNPYFNEVTTNEAAGALTTPDGRGVALFQVNTGIESTGLGCGQKVQPVGGGDRKVPKCWIVVVPRGTAAEENVGTPFNTDEFGVMTSPLAPNAWKNRIAIPIAFNPVDSPCSINADERRVAGNELALAAVQSWQPALCGGGQLPPYAYVPVSDSTARLQLTNPSSGSPGLIVTSRPLDPANVDPSNPVVYAPLTASALVIGFNVERRPTLAAPSAEQALDGVRVASINLTPRLVAKLLTQSYAQQVKVYNTDPKYSWLTDNPLHLGVDQDFVRFNPEFSLLNVVNIRTFSGLQLASGSSDAAQQVWQWVLADPEAKAWLDGQPDPWGMRVNPLYSTNAAVNPNGVAFDDPAPSSFPKSDPYCYQAPKLAQGGVTPPLLCGTDWMPYVRTFGEAAQVTRAAADRPRVIPNPFALTAADAWQREAPQTVGQRSMLALTDSPSAARFGLQVARLSRAGDDGSDRTFVAPDTPGINAGVASMVPGAEPTVLEPSPATAARGAYPLTTLSYGAIAPLALDTGARADYAALLDYAAGAGQTAGLEPGQLPPGYVSLPSALRAQTNAAATTVRDLVPPTEPATTTTATATTTATSTTTSAAPSTSEAATTAPAPTSPPLTAARTNRVVRSSRATTPRPSTVRTAQAQSVDQPPATEPAPPPSEETAATPTGAASPPPDTAAPTSTPPTTRKPAGVGLLAVTPILAMGQSRLAIPALGIVALLSALGALEITKRPRRARAPEPGTDDVAAGGG